MYSKIINDSTFLHKKNFLRFLSSFHDNFAGILSWFLAYLIRFNFNFNLAFTSFFSLWFWLSISIKIFIVFYLALHRLTWRYVGTFELRHIAFASTLNFFLLSSFFLIVNTNTVTPPRSVIFLDSLIFFLILSGSRFFYRIIKEHYLIKEYRSDRLPIILFGVGDFTTSLLKNLFLQSEWNIVAIIDDDIKNNGMQLYDLRVQKTNELNNIIARHNVKHAIVSIDSSSYKQKHFILNLLKKYNLKILTVNNINELINSQFNNKNFHEIAIEDLLRRETVSLDNIGLKKIINKKTLLVSGAGGSIGSELCRQIIKFNPKNLICLDISEFGLYKIEQEFNKLKYAMNVIFLICDIKNKSKLTKILIKYKPAIVFHAAAYKHVPLMENDNVLEALYNNVIGTYNFAYASKKANVDKFILVSTDKAVNPTNVMGATKRLAEMICIALQSRSRTSFITVRFGNVLDSSGSVIPKFREQIKSGGPVTVTHPNVTRYFMSIPEASQLVMQSSLIGKGGEIFILDMGESVRILDLAKDMIKLSGIEGESIKIKYIGLRPGEKLYEELLSANDSIVPSTHEKLKIAKTKKIEYKWIKKLLIWINSMENKDEKIIKLELKKWVPEYQSFKE